MCLFLLNKRLGCLSPGQVPSDFEEFISAAQTVISITQRMRYRPPVHKLWRTKDWLALRDLGQNMYQLARKHLEEKAVVLEDEGDGEKHNFMSFMLRDEKISMKEAAVNTINMMAGGIDTVSGVMREEH